MAASRECLAPYVRRERMYGAKELSCAALLLTAGRNVVAYPCRHSPKEDRPMRLHFNRSTIAAVASARARGHWALLAAKRPPERSERSETSKASQLLRFGDRRIRVSALAETLVAPRPV